MPRLKMPGATTVDDGSSMCLSCRFAAVVNHGDYIQCRMLGIRITKKVYECNSYNLKSTTSIENMEEVAWILRTDNKTKKIGFRPLKDVKRELEEPDY